MQHGFIVPVSALEKYATYSNFHLILPHLFAEYPAYKEFYQDRIKEGDHVLLDNSIFELGTSFNPRTMLELGEEMQVTELSAPEYLGNAEKTLRLVYEFLELRESTGMKSTGVLCVVQGQSFDELINSFFELNGVAEVTALGLPFDIDFSTDVTKDVDSLTARRVINRNTLIDLIIKRAKKDNTVLKPTHLMGLGDACELEYYSNKRGKEGATSDYDWVRSNDSSSAFVHGMNLVKYTTEGLPCEKISQKLDFGLSIDDFTSEQHDCIMHNIRQIKHFII